MHSRQMTAMLSLKRIEKQEVALSGLKVDEDVYGMVKGPRQSPEDYTRLFSITCVMEDRHTRWHRSLSSEANDNGYNGRKDYYSYYDTQNPTPMRTSASIARIITPRAIRTSQRFSAKLGINNHSWQVFYNEQVVFKQQMICEPAQSHLAKHCLLWFARCVVRHLNYYGDANQL